MPYKDRIQQLTYMRDYMRTRRLAARLQRLKQQRETLKQRLESDSVFARFMQQSEEDSDSTRRILGIEPVRSGPFSYFDNEIARVESLLKNQQKCRISGDALTPSGQGSTISETNSSQGPSNESTSIISQSEEKSMSPDVTKKEDTANQDTTPHD